MNGSMLEDAFGHHVWATLTLIDTCLGLTPEQLQAELPGIYGPILPTMRHLVGADISYLWVVSGGAVPEIDEEQMGLAELRAAMEAGGRGWMSFLAGDLDPAATVVRHRDDGTDSSAPLGIRLAQALHHGTDHRSQICTALTNLGVQPPEIDAWDFARRDGRLSVTPTPTPSDG
jgi:uncharacterized damage-inducible protein DinB